MASSAWTTLLVTCILGLVFPSDGISILWFKLPDKLISVLFPLRSLISKKLVKKNELICTIVDIRKKYGVNGVAVIWYIFALAAIIVLLIMQLTGNLTESFVTTFKNVIFIFFGLCFLLLAVGIFLGDRKYRERYAIASVSPEQLHQIEQLIAYQVEQGIEDCQEKMMKSNKRWVVDILCTDHLEDKPSDALKGAFSAFLGVGQTNPVYMSHATVRLLNDDDEEVPFPVRRKTNFDISYTQNSTLILFDKDHVTGQIVKVVEDVTRMY